MLFKNNRISKCDRLHNQDVCTAVTETVSSGFKSEQTPISEGMTMLGNAPNSPKLKIIKFFADVAKILKNRQRNIRNLAVKWS